MALNKVVLLLLISFCGFSLGNSVFEVKSDRLVNTVEKNFIGLNLDPLNFYSDDSGEHCSKIFKLVDTLVLTAPGYIRITSSNHESAMKMDADFNRNFFKFVKDINSKIILNYETYDSDFELDIGEKIMIADEIGFKQIFLEINMANINSTCDEFVEELKIMRNLTRSEAKNQDIQVKIVISNIQHCLFEKSEKEQKYFLFKISENSDAVIFSNADLNSIEGITKENIPNTLRLWGTEAWTLMESNLNNNEKLLPQTVMMIGEATKSGFTRIFEDIEDAFDRKSNSEMSGVEFFLTIYKLSAGSNIINVISNNTETDVKVYAQCSEEKDSLFIYAINSANESRNLTIDLDLKDDGNKFTEYIITEIDGLLNINGETYDPKNVDNLIKGVEAIKPFSITLPPNSVGLWPTVPVDKHVCKKFNFEEMNQGIAEEIYEHYPERNERVKRKIDDDDNSTAVEIEKSKDIDEEAKVTIVVINSSDNTTEESDVETELSVYEEFFFDEIDHIAKLVKNISVFLNELYADKDEKNCNPGLKNNSVELPPVEKEDEDIAETNETKENHERVPRQLTDEIYENYGESEHQMEERIGTFGRNIRPLHFPSLERQKLDHALMNAKQSMLNLKLQHQAKKALRPQLPALKPGFKDLALKDKLLTQKLKAENLRQKMKMDMAKIGLPPKGKLGHLLKRDTHLHSIDDSSPKSCESKIVEIFKAPESKMCKNQASNIEEVGEPSKRYKYAGVWNKNLDPIDNYIKKRSLGEELDETFDLISQASNDDWSWENIKCKLGFCEQRNQLQEIVDKMTKIYNNLRIGADDLWRSIKG